MGDRSDRKAATADSFGENADSYRHSETHSEGADLELLGSWCSDATVALDVATGAGHTAGALREAGVARVVSADAAPAMVATTVRSFPDVAGVVADAERLPFETDAFDAVTCRIAAHHFPDPETFVGEVARVLRSGGTFAFEDTVAPEDDALADFLNHLERMRDPTHVEAYRASTWERWLAEDGFAVEATERFSKPLPFDRWIDRIGSPSAAARDAVHRILLDAPDDVAAAFGVETDNGRVQSFRSPKAAIRATKTS